MQTIAPPSRWYEDIAEGEVFTSQRRTVTEADIVAYVGLSWDAYKVHVDEELMKDTPFGGRIAHGFLTVAMSSGLSGRHYFDFIELQAHLESTFRFENAVRPGDTIHTVVTVLEKRLTRDPKRGIVTFGREIFNQRGQRTANGQTKLMVFTRAQAPA